VISRHLRGRLAEWAATVLLRLRGYRILARRYKTHVGEIDIIASRQRLVVFVEVKARLSTADALAAVRAPQRRRVERAARQFLATRPELADRDLRFDVVVFDRFGLPRHLADAWRPAAGAE
jgi:putative endonuclease